MAESVLDASVAISWCFPGDPTEDTPYSRSILKELIVRDAIVPEIWAFEIANNIFVSHRKRNLINEQHITKYLGLLKALPIRVQSQTLWTNAELESCARRSDIAAYDASCLVLALRKKIPRATSDALRIIPNGARGEHKALDAAVKGDGRKSDDFLIGTGDLLCRQFYRRRCRISGVERVPQC
jgi:predicted nucleic acid-binding protein